MITVGEIDLKIIAVLMGAHSSLDISTLYLRTKLDISQITESVLRLAKEGLLVVDDTNVGLTSDGRAWVVQNDRLFGRREKKWRDIPDGFEKAAIDPLQPYVPLLDEVHDSIRNRILEKLG